MEKHKSYFSHQRRDIAALFPKEARKVLDIGCGTGALGKIIKVNGAEVVGVEKDEVSCGIAKECLDKVLCLDAERDELPFEDGYFDCIIYGDILEHFYDPWAALKKHKRFLKEGGFVLASIPNIKYYKILIRLFAGTWDYVDAGMLDKSHIRFFTLINIKELFENNGFCITLIKRNIIASRAFRVLNFLLCSILKDFLTYQYYIIAKNAQPEKQKAKARIVYKF